MKHVHFQAPNNQITYELDGSQNTADVLNFFAVETVMETGAYLGSLSVKRSLVQYPNTNTQFTVQVSAVFL